MTWAYRDLAAYYALSGRIDDARRAVSELVKTRPGLTIATVAETLKFVEPQVLSRYLDGLRIAGLAG